MRKQLHRPSPAMVISLVALFVALGGTTYAATGGNVILGAANTATSPTSLTSKNAGAALNITQQSTGTGATALALIAPAGKPPMTVNSGTKVANFNADKLDGRDSTAFAAKAQEPWHEIGAPGEPSFIPGQGGPIWANWGNGTNTVGFYKDSVGQVHLKGTFKALANVSDASCESTPVFILPVGYRPSATEIEPVLHNDTLARIDVLNTGWVVICEPSSWNAGEYFSLDGINFRAGG